MIDDDWNAEDEAEHAAWVRFVAALPLADASVFVSLVRVAFRRRAQVSAWLDSFKTAM